MMMLIRRFEERTYQEYTKPGQRIGGFCHLYSGQEAVAVGIAAIFQKGKDYLINGYRDHGHSLALGMDPKLAMAEMFGRATGCSKGKGGSMHLLPGRGRQHGRPRHRRRANSAGHRAAPSPAGTRKPAAYASRSSAMARSTRARSTKRSTSASLCKLPVHLHRRKQRHGDGHAGRAPSARRKISPSAAPATTCRLATSTATTSIW